MSCHPILQERTTANFRHSAEVIIVSGIMCILCSSFTGNVGKQVDGREDNSKQTTSYGKRRYMHSVCIIKFISQSMYQPT